LHAKIVVGCDGASALQQASKRVDFINPNERQFDIIMAIRHVITATDWDWHWTHVKGHQDDLKASEELDQWSLWNIAMDTSAKKFWSDTVAQHISPGIFGEPWPTIISTGKITSNLRDELREACTTGPALQYWDRKQRFGSLKASNIDWEAFGAAMKASPGNKQRWISKTLSGFCSTGRMMHRRRERSTDECPRCGLSENVEHIWRCQHETSEIWDRSLQSLEEWLLANSTHPDMVRIIKEGLNRWRAGEDTARMTSKIPWLNEALKKQAACGWRNFFEGMIILDWRDVVAAHMSRIRSPKSSRRWLTALIRKLWQIAWDLWEHRNGFLHAHENSLISHEVNKEIRNQFEVGYMDLDKQTRALFLPDVYSILQKPLDIRQQWVRRVLAARDKDGGTYQTERRLMANWLANAK
jgi:hypothetical protein